AVDPVEELRLALRVQVLDQAMNPDEIKFRDRNVGKAVAALRSIGDSRRALQLQAAWRDEEPEAPLEVREMDRKYRSEIIRRFRDDLRNSMKSGNPLVQTAAADLVNEVGVSIRGSAPEDAGGVMRSLAPDLVGL